MPAITQSFRFLVVGTQVSPSRRWHFALRNNSSNTAQMSLYRGLKIVLQGSGKLEIIKSYHCIRTFLGKASW
jgi:hypothetical protein